jgi:hypothetical protein
MVAKAKSLSESGFVYLDEDMSEVMLLVPSYQANRLEKEAQRRGLSAACLLRGLINSFLCETGYEDKATP